MRAAIAIAAREVRERMILFAGAGLLGALTLLLPFMPGVEGYGYLETMDGAAWMMAGVVLLAGSFVHGATIIGRDLSERRLAFYFTRPVSGGAVWGGKMLAAVALPAIEALILLIPASILGRGLFTLAGEGDVAVYAAGAVVLAVGLAAAGHVLGVIALSRSAWMAVDLVGLVTTAALVMWALEPLLQFAWIAGRGTGPDFHAWLVIGVGGVIAVLLLGAGAIGIIRARIDLRRVHRATSLTLWISALTLASCLAGCSWWMRSATPRELFGNRESWYAEPDGRGWIYLQGTARGIPHTFLANLNDARWVRMPEGPCGDVSRDGAYAIACRESFSWFGSGRDLSFEIMDLRKATQTWTVLHDVPAAERYYGTRVTLSADGSRAAIFLRLAGDSRDEQVLVFDTAERRLLASLKAPQDTFVIRSDFVNSGLIRLLARGPNDVRRAFEIDVTSKRMIETGSWKTRSYWYQLDPKGGLEWSYRAPVAADSGESVVRDARTGTVMLDLSGRLSTGGRHRFAWLSNGNIGLLETRDGRVRLIELTRDGTEVRAVDLGAGAITFMCGELSPGRVLLVVVPGPQRRDQPGPRGQAEVVDLETGKVEVILRNVAPATWLPLPEDLGESPHLFRAADHRLLALDPKTLEVRPLFE